MYSVKMGDTLYQLARQYNTTVEAILQKNPGINFRNIRIGQKIIIPANSSLVSGTRRYSKQDLQNLWRQLWEQHVAWTRMTILSAASDNPDFNATEARLLRNPADMGEAMKPFYGEANALKFKNLIEQHLKIAVELVGAAKAGNKEAAADAEKRWYANGDEIVGFLHSINPYISAAGFKNMFYNHLALTKSEAVEILNKNYEKNIALYDQIENQALMMADTISNGIISQFPQLF